MKLFLFILSLSLLLFFVYSKFSSLPSDVTVEIVVEDLGVQEREALPESVQDKKIETTELWTSFDPSLPKPHLRKDIDDAVLLRYQREQLLDLEEGSLLDLVIPQDEETLKVLITKREILKSGNLILKGHIDGDALFSFVMTVGGESVFATLGTREGIYNLSGNRQQVWVIPAASLRKQMNTDILDYRSKKPAPVEQIPREQIPSTEMQTDSKG